MSTWLSEEWQYGSVNCKVKVLRSDRQTCTNRFRLSNRFRLNPLILNWVGLNLSTKNGIEEMSWIAYLLEMNWVWIELSLSTKRKNWIWFESSLTQKNLKELRVCKTWMRIHKSTYCWLETFSLHHETSIESKVGSLLNYYINLSKLSPLR